MAGRKPYHHGNLHNALLEAALGLIREVGLRGFTLRAVARRAGVSHAAPYRHFREKAALLAALAEDGFDRLTAAMQAAGATSQDPFGRLQQAGLAYIAFAQAQPEHFLVMFSIALDAQRHPAAKAAANRCFAELVALVTACQHARDGLPSKTAARMAWTHVHGIAELALRGQLGFSTSQELREFAQLAIEVFGRGAHLAPPSTRSAGGGTEQ
jgi:AcrR family transcriptional regulator